ncbi:DUF4124 domain-containing protein [Thermodesulfobacteriota bacterium]
MKKLNIIIALTFILIFVFNVNAEIYYWVDENGVKHFSNANQPQNAKTLNTYGEKKYVEPPHENKATDTINQGSEIQPRKSKKNYEREAKKINDKLMAVQSEIDKVISWRDGEIGRIDTDQTIIDKVIVDGVLRNKKNKIMVGTVSEIESNAAKKRINILAEQKLEKLKLQREILLNQLQELYSKSLEE